MHRIILSILCFLPCFAQAAALDSCSRVIDAKDTGTLRIALEDSGLPHYIEGNTVCVEKKHRYAFQILLNETFSRTSKIVQKDWIYIPKSPRGDNLEYLMPINPDMHEALKKVLTEREIWFTTDKEDILWFELANRSKVLDIIFDISEGKIKVDSHKY
ncbi:hypothetical protein MMIC_P2312 [Mariprofundus micogutta]|uniref:Uncharacterized protein n=1 Tax=Mariprofundus micogutta TaxID=1921010 RepID=A0A1L8CQZ4_9PROT|nr:hypothetical protein [Mariprofundus micogutta]GAV21328.1 hypothetical protein MMIC_P2312 [Mariprofundus micogutta]